MTTAAPADSLWSLSWELLSAKALVWVATAGRDVQLTPEAHIYFFDRYRRLADYHRAHGRSIRAEKLEVRAEEHFRASGGIDGPPYAAAMAMPRPRFTFTDLVSRHRIDDSGDDVA